MDTIVCRRSPSLVVGHAGGAWFWQADSGKFGWLKRIESIDEGLSGGQLGILAVSFAALIECQKDHASYQK